MQIWYYFGQNCTVLKCFTTFETKFMQFWLNIWVLWGQKHFNQTLFCYKWWQEVMPWHFASGFTTKSTSKCWGHYKSTTVLQTALFWHLFLPMFCVESILTSTWIWYQCGPLRKFLYTYTYKSGTIYVIMAPNLQTAILIQPVYCIYIRKGKYSRRWFTTII